MKVFNLTDNSFSDGGRNFNSSSLEENFSHFKEKIQDEVEQTKTSFVLDYGAQSTAPMNEAISQEEEIERFQQILFPLIKSNSFFKPTHAIEISIDTYRPETFEFVYKAFNEVSPEYSLIWNDVSGDREGVISFLKNRAPNAQYVYSHNRAPSRAHAAKHMGFVSATEVEVIEEITEDFMSMRSAFKNEGMEDRLILDVCFGFSKSLEENWKIIGEFINLVKKFPNDQKWLLGLSRKSFLRALVSKGESKAEHMKRSEVIHEMIIGHYMRELKDYSLIFRGHDHEVFLGAQL
jgi:dihydropteroate synthase